MASYPIYPATENGLGNRGAVIVPSDSNIAGGPKAIVCLTSGNLTIVPTGNADGDTLTFTGVYPGFVPPYRVRRLTAATATVAAVYD